MGRLYRAIALVASATSMSVDGTHVFRTPFRDASLSSSGGIYPWNLEGESSAVVYLQNVSDTPHDYTLQIVFDGGAYVLGVKNLAARQVIAYDIRELRDQQIPDVVGRTIPQHITSGKVHWSIRGTGDRSLIGRIEQVDSVKGLSMTSACGTCCPNSFANVFMSPGSVTGFPGNTTQFTAEEADMDCFGNPLPVFPVTNFGFWSSGNTSVATVNQSGLATAVGPGSTFINFSSTGEVWTNCCTECGNEESCCESETVPATCEALCDVQQISVTWQAPNGLGVPLASGTPPQGAHPYVKSITITATGNPSGGTYSWSTTSNKVSLSNANSATVTANAVTQSSSKDDVTVKISYAVNNQPAATADIKLTVQKPTKFGFVSVDQNEAPQTCPTGQAGLRKVIKWQLMDHLNPANPISLALPNWNDMIVGNTNTCVLTLSGTLPTDPGAITGAGGQWSHIYHFCSTVCVGGTCQTTGNQRYKTNGFTLTDLPFTFACNGITVDGH